MAEFIHSGNKKKQFVQEMFEDVSHKYDFLNHFLSFGLDYYWRKKLVQYAEVESGYKILDVATGTGDVAFAFLKKYDVEIIGLDYAFNMVKIAKSKAQKFGHTNKTLFVQGDGESLPFPNDSFDRLTISFGFRNIGHYDTALKEFKRVLKPGGQLLILEFSEPKSKIFNGLYQFYFKHILPRLGALLSRADAYRYLPESVEHFPPRDEVCHLMIDSGFEKAEYYDFTFGVCSIFVGYN